MTERELARRKRFKAWMGEYYLARHADLERLESATAMYATEVQDYIAAFGRPMYFKRWLIESRGIPR